MTEFAKKTGDYASLSATDIKVLALTYQLEVEVNGSEHLKTEPQMKKNIVVGPRPPGPEKVEKIAGFHMPKVADPEVKELTEQVDKVAIEEEKTNEGVSEAATAQEDEEEYSDVESGEEEEEEEEEDDDDDGWITPGNIEQVKHSMNGVLETVQVDVACITTDFAMQVIERLPFMSIERTLYPRFLVYRTSSCRWDFMWSPWKAGSSMKLGRTSFVATLASAPRAM